MKNNLCGQNLTEFVLFLAVIAAVITGMQLYTQRALQARYKDGVDYLFTNIKQMTQGGAAVNSQYDPYYQESERSQTHNQVSDKLVDGSIVTNSTVTNSGWQRINSAEDEDAD